MAQHKYDLLTVPTVAEGPRRHHPWYKERLRLKFLKPSKQAAALNGQKWTFVANDMDDFRTGVPTKTNGKRMVKHGHVNSIPLISSKSHSLQRSNSHITPPQPESRILSNNPGVRTLNSKIGSRRQIQQERVEREKSALLKHPLQLYPHLEDSIPIELLDDVLGIVDPGLKAEGSISQLSSSGSESQASTTIDEVNEFASRMSDLRHVVTPQHDQFSSVSDSQPQQSKLYKFPLKKTNEEKEMERMVVASQQVISATQQSRVDQVTYDLVQWMEDMGDSDDEKCSMDESMIKNLFSSDYESKPMVMAPIHVVDLLNVPPELRLESRDYSRSGYSSSPSIRPTSENHYRFGRARGFTYPATVDHSEEPRYIRTKYGAWYLPVDLWRVRDENEALRDPREVDAEMDSEEAMKGLAMNEMLSELHGARGFKEFVLTKKPGSIMPSFLENVNLNSTNGQSQRQHLTRT